MSNTNGLDTFDRKDRVPSTSSFHGNVVDHDAPHGIRPFSLYITEGSTSAVTEEHDHAKRHAAEGKAHMISVQPLRRSEMQVRFRNHTLRVGLANVMNTAVVRPGSGSG